MGRIIFDSRPPTEKRTEAFNFLSMLGPGVTLSNPSVSVTVWSGTDPLPNDILSGSPTVSGSQVLQKFLDGVVGTIYAVTCSVDTSDGQTLQLTGYMAVVADTL